MKTERELGNKYKNVNTMLQGKKKNDQTARGYLAQTKKTKEGMTTIFKYVKKYPVGYRSMYFVLPQKGGVYKEESFS